MNFLEYIFNVLTILSIIDIIICYYQIHKSRILIKLFGISTETKIKMYIEKLLIIIWIFYLIYKFIF
jgi:hypothetical protein